MKLIVGNFKMNLLKEDINNYLKTIKDKDLSNVVFCPSSIYLTEFASSNFNTGSQDIGFMESGAYTGDISALQLKSLGVKYTLVGHSERRKYYQDRDYVNKKIGCAINNGLTPILCIGETKEERDNNLTNLRLKDDIDKAFSNNDSLSDIIIAYEPLWSIGTGLIPSNKEIFDTILYIKEYVKSEYNFDVKVLYGGSVNNNNILELETVNNIDGYLVGGCSLDTNKFLDLINKINNI